MQDMRYEIRRYVIGLVVLFLTGSALVVFSSSSYGFASKPERVEAIKAEPTEDSGLARDRKTRGAPNAVEVPKAESPESRIIGAACELIYRGEFDAAHKLTKNVPFQHNTSLRNLLKIAAEYQAISQQREATRKSAYEEHLAKLEKLRTGEDANDANDTTKVLSVIAAVREFADERQKAELVSDPFVTDTFQKAKEKASEFESKGKWLDAYITCYSWLQTIVPKNQEYSDYAEQLIEKASIVTSFQNSPCESRKERYEKVEQQMFTRAIDALNVNYVSIIDYRQMATKAIRRCELLAEVINSSSVVRDALWEKDPNTAAREDTQYEKKLTAWLTELAAILDEVNRPATGFSKDKFIDVFEKVLTKNTETIELPPTVLIAHFAEAALSSLDPYTVMVWPRQVQDFEKMMTNEFTGIGIEISKQRGLLTVASLLPDTPAYNSGLDAGDVIVEVDDVPTKDMSLTCAVRRITGPANTKVTLTIKRPGEDETMDIPIIRARITVPTIRGWQRTEAGSWLYMIDETDKIGYVRLTSFSATTVSDFEKVLNGLEAEGLKGLILDLRFNSGGLLPTAIEMSDKFIEEGLIVKTQPRFMPTYASAHKEGTHPNYPLVILINRYSASASEIVSGALHDKAHKRAILVGERTLGKGLVQGITPYPSGGAQLKYTMAYYHLPSGQKVESQDEMKKQGRKDWGVGPDIEIQLRSDEVKKIVDVQKDNDVLVRAGHDNGRMPLKKRTAEETLAADPQLAVGILVVKSKLIEEETRSVKPEAARL